MKLYDLTNAYMQLLEQAETDDAIAILDTLESIEEEIHSKAENIAFVLQELKGDINTLDNEIKRLQARKKAIQNNHERLRTYLVEELEKAHLDKVKSAHFTISIRDTPAKVTVLDENLIPDQYYIIKKSVNKTALKEAIQNGENIEGITLEQGKGLYIK